MRSSEVSLVLVRHSPRNRALELNPKLAAAHYYSGMVRFNQGQMEQAVQEFQAELTLNSRYIPAMYQLVYVHLEQHQTDEAIRLLTDVVAQKPSYADACAALGKALLEKGDVQAAIRNLEMAGRLQPSADRSYYQLSLAYRRAGRLDEAQHALRKYEELKTKRQALGKHEQQD